jgi:hypothetical protein
VLGPGQRRYLAVDTVEYLTVLARKPGRGIPLSAVVLAVVWRLRLRAPARVWGAPAMRGWRCSRLVGRVWERRSPQVFGCMPSRC